MKAFKLIFAGFLLTACGAEDEDTTMKTKEPQFTVEKEKEAPEEEPKTKEKVVEYRKDGDDYALALETTKELPDCTRSNSKQMAYIKSENLFFVCDDETLIWTEIEVRGKDGEKGDQGEKGEKGDEGRPAAENEWVDPITEERWLIGPVVTEGQISYGVPPCSNGWSLPTKEEAAVAVVHGLILVGRALSPSQNGIWTEDFDIQNGTAYRFYIDLLGKNQPANHSIAGQSSVQAAVACIKE